MYRVEGQDKYVLDHNVDGWMLESKHPVQVAKGTTVQIVDEVQDERGSAVIFVLLDKEGVAFVRDVCANADDLWDVPEVEADPMNWGEAYKGYV
jgi:hypothetical protein